MKKMFIILFVAVASPAPIWGQDMLYNQEFQVNTSTENPINGVEVISLQDGGFIFCWDVYRQDGSKRGISAQLFDENGQQVGTEFQVNTHTDDDQIFPRATTLSDGGFVICWQSKEQDGSGHGVFAQRFDKYGEKLGNEFQVNSYMENVQANPAVTSLNNGGFVICWPSEQQDGSGWGVFAQRFDEYSNKAGKEFQVNTYKDKDQRNPTIISLTNNTFVICWDSHSQDGYPTDVFAQLFDVNGDKVEKEFKVNTSTKNNQWFPVVSSLNDNGFVICWQSDHQDGSPQGIFAKYFLAKPIEHILMPFNLNQPATDTRLSTNKPAFSWREASAIRKCYPWELSYDLFIASEPVFTQPRIISGIQDTTYQIDSLGVGQTYFWKVLAKNIVGDSLWSSTVNGFAVSPNATAVEETETVELPEEIELHANYPNPFNPETRISFSIPAGKTQPVSLNIYDIRGRLVRQLLQQNTLPGHYSLTWNGRDNLGEKVPSGVYVYRLIVGPKTLQKKMTLVR